jgi:hypothetical protein
MAVRPIRTHFCFELVTLGTAFTCGDTPVTKGVPEEDWRAHFGRAVAVSQRCRQPEARETALWEVAPALSRRICRFPASTAHSYWQYGSVVRRTLILAPIPRLDLLRMVWIQREFHGVGEFGQGFVLFLRSERRQTSQGGRVGLVLPLSSFS